MIDWGALKTIVVFRTDHIGDLIVSTPFLRALRLSAPQAKIVAVVARPTLGVLQHSQLVDETVCQNDWSDHPLAKPGAVDCAIALSPRTATYKLASATKARYRAGYYYSERFFAGLGCRWWLTHPFPQSIRSLLKQGLKVPHEIEQHRRFADYLGLAQVDLNPELGIDEPSIQWGGELAQGRLALHLSPNWLTQNWTVLEFAQFCSQLPSCFLTAGPAEIALSQGLRATPNWNLDCFEGLDFAKWAGILKASKAVITTDTGAVHIAAAFGVPVVVVYKPEQEDICKQQWFPWNTNFRTVTLSTPAQTLANVRLALDELSAQPS